MAQNGLVFVLFGVGIALAGGGLIRKYHRRKQDAAAIEAADPRPIADLRVGDGPVQIEGRVEQIGPDLLSAPLDQRREGVIVESRIRESQNAQDPDAGPAEPGVRGGFGTVYADRESIPFAVDDGTDSIRVELDGGAETMLDGTTATFEEGRRETNRARTFLESVPDIEPAAGERREYYQGTVEPGDEVFVAGAHVEEENETLEHRRLLTGAGMTLTTESKEGVVRGTRLPKTAYYALGGLLILIGVGIAALGASAL